jgi:membrane associated rhomboid family serine protease
MPGPSISQLWPFPKAVKTILIVHASLWLLTIIAWRLGNTAVFDALALTPSQVWPGGHLWQIFTYMWLHALGEFYHILLNMLFLWMFGGVLAERWGASAFVRFYLLCGISAGIAVAVIGHFLGPAERTVGASGAIYGLVAAWAIAFPDHRVYLFGVLPIRGRHFALVPIGFAVLEFLVGGTGTSHVAHLAGLAAGALLVTGYWRPLRVWNRLRYLLLKRRLKIIEGDRKN